MGATRQVLDQDFLPGEAHEHVEKQFKKRLRQLNPAGKPPPRFGCFDDVAKMRHAFLRWVKDVWEEDPEDIKDYRTPQVVLDIQHFKMLLLEGLEESHPDYKDITSDMGQALGRPLGYKNFYTTPEKVREDFQRIYSKYKKRGKLLAFFRHLSLCIWIRGRNGRSHRYRPVTLPKHNIPNLSQL